MQLYIGEGCKNTFLVIKQQQAVRVGSRLHQKLISLAIAWKIDSILVIVPSRELDCEMRILETDGTESVMCGNGLRVIAHILAKNHPRQKRFFIGVSQEVYEVTVVGEGYYKTTIAATKDTKRGIILAGGEPHLILPGESTASELAYCVQGQNVNASRLEMIGGKVYIQTWERGVGRFTLSCGTAVVSACTALRAKGRLKNQETEFKTPGGSLWATPSKKGVVLVGSASARRLNEGITFLNPNHLMLPKGS